VAGAGVPAKGVKGLVWGEAGRAHAARLLRERPRSAPGPPRCSGTGGGTGGLAAGPGRAGGTGVPAAGPGRAAGTGRFVRVLPRRGEAGSFVFEWLRGRW